MTLRKGAAMIANEVVAKLKVQEAIRDGMRAQQIQRALRGEEAPHPGAQPGWLSVLLEVVRLALALLLQP
jgi:hypothetical protein